MNKRSIAITCLVFSILLVITCVYFISPHQAVSELTPEASQKLPEISEDSSSEMVEESVAPESSDVTETVRNPEADALVQSFASIGEDYILHSRYYRQGETQTEDAPRLGWDGDLVLHVDSAEIREYNAEEGEEDSVKSIWERYAPKFANPCVLHLELSLENRNAEYKNGIKYQFNISMFKLSAYEDLLPENWQSSGSYALVGERYGAQEAYFNKHEQGNSYWDFYLEPGERMDFVLEFLIDRSYLSQDQIFLAVSRNRHIQYGVLLDEIADQ